MIMLSLSCPALRYILLASKSKYIFAVSLKDTTFRLLMEGGNNSLPSYQEYLDNQLNISMLHQVSLQLLPVLLKVMMTVKSIP